MDDRSRQSAFVEPHTVHALNPLHGFPPLVSVAGDGTILIAYEVSGDECVRKTVPNVQAFEEFLQDHRILLAHSFMDALKAGDLGHGRTRTWNLDFADFERSPYRMQATWRVGTEVHRDSFALIGEAMNRFDGDGILADPPRHRSAQAIIKLGTQVIYQAEVLPVDGTPTLTLKETELARRIFDHQRALQREVPVAEVGQAL